MTNTDRLLSLIGFAPNANSMEGVLIDMGIDGTAVYDASLSSSLKQAAIQIMELLLTTPDKTNTDGYTIKFDRKSVLARINQLKGELGLLDDPSLPYVTSRPVW